MAGGIVLDYNLTVCRVDRQYKPEGSSMKNWYAIALALFIGIGIGATAIHALYAQSKPPAYVIGEIDVLDQDGYAREYQSRSVKPIVEEGGAKFLSRGAKTISIRGEPPKRIVLFAFENLDRAQAAFASPGYAEAYAHGEKYAKFRIYAIEGISP
jgi:uncharacterized protein (DUF1330 family)